jgi:hypothetical protein
VVQGALRRYFGEPVYEPTVQERRGLDGALVVVEQHPEGGRPWGGGPDELMGETGCRPVAAVGRGRRGPRSGGRAGGCRTIRMGCGPLRASSPASGGPRRAARQPVRSSASRLLMGRTHRSDATGRCLPPRTAEHPTCRTIHVQPAGRKRAGEPDELSFMILSLLVVSRRRCGAGGRRHGAGCVP